MNKNVAKSLYDKATDVAFYFSNPDREFNISKETFKVGKIKPLSDLTAAVHFNKTSGKVGVAFFYWVKSNGGHWKYFFPTDSHILGMVKMGDVLHDVELLNFDKNFENNREDV